MGSRLFLPLLLPCALAIPAGRLSACSCLPQGTEYDLNRASVVFRGVVTGTKDLPRRREMGDRRRYTATLSVSEHWKGKPGRVVTLHLLELGKDCVGARFDDGREYIVFAREERATDYRIGDAFWYGWLDLMPRGRKILTVNNFCDSTAEVSQAGETLKALGTGRKPH